MLIAGGLLGVPLGKSSLKGDLTDWPHQVVNRHRRGDVKRRRRAAPILQSASITNPNRRQVSTMEKLKRWVRHTNDAPMYRVNGDGSAGPEICMGDSPSGFVRSHDVDKLESRIAELQAKVERLEVICSAAYQLAGAVGAPVRFLDALGLHDDVDVEKLLPVSALECTEIASRQSWQESTAVYLADADRALAVLFTMLTKVGLKEGAAVADETRAHVRAALKEVAHSKSTAQPLPGGMQRDKMPGECAPIWPPEPEKLPEKQQ